MQTKARGKVSANKKYPSCSLYAFRQKNLTEERKYSDNTDKPLLDILLWSYSLPTLAEGMVYHPPPGKNLVLNLAIATKYGIFESI